MRAWITTVLKRRIRIIISLVKGRKLGGGGSVVNPYRFISCAYLVYFVFLLCTFIFVHVSCISNFYWIYWCRNELFLIPCSTLACLFLNTKKNNSEFHNCNFIPSIYFRSQYKFTDLGQESNSLNEPISKIGFAWWSISNFTILH